MGNSPIRSKSKFGGYKEEAVKPGWLSKNQSDMDNSPIWSKSKIWGYKEEL
jgi:hypothetical protein